MTPYRVLMVHNAYQQVGGEDGVVAAELALLRKHGHEVIEFRRDNHDISNMSRSRVAVDIKRQLRLAAGSQATLCKIITMHG